MAKPQAMSPGLEGKMKDFRKEVTAGAETIIFSTLPTKILELTTLVQSMNNDSSPFNQHNMTDTTVYPPPTVMNGETDFKKRKLSADELLSSSVVNDMSSARYNNQILTNKHINALHDRVKKECEELIDICDKVKLWVSLTMPKIEDGDNFGVQIQEEVLSELHRSQESGYNLRDNPRSNALCRAKICSKLIKYPFVEDYAIALREHDSKQIFMARQNLVDIKSIYAVLTDMIHKNIEKLRSPKGNNRVGIY